MGTSMNIDRRLSMLIALGLAIVILTNIPAVEGHSLEWGVMPSSQFEYTANGNRQDIGIVDLNYSLTIDALGSIPESPIFPLDFPRTTVSLQNLEDSSNLDMGDDISSLCYGSFSAMPIGDWDYLSTLVEAYSDGTREVVAFANTTHWGYSNNGEWWDARVLLTTIYLKENGIMEYYSGSHWSFITFEMIEDVTIRRITASTSTTTTPTNPTTPTTTTGTPTTTTGTTTSTPTTTIQTTTENNLKLDPSLKLASIGASATVSYGLLGLILKADFVEERKHKAAVVLTGVLILASIAVVIWVLL
jgi:hypothetical protein